MSPRYRPHRLEAQEKSLAESADLDRRLDNAIIDEHQRELDAIAAKASPVVFSPTSKIRQRREMSPHYGVSHRTARRRWQRRVEQGLVSCARCGQPISPYEPWDLD